jgi:peptidoglycan/xylan/chitin deacetylase (PgdA/CDA1 family)
VCEFEAAVVAELAKHDWCFFGHRMTNSQYLTNLSEGEERTVIRDTLDTIEKAARKQSLGWLGPGLAESYRTPELLLEAGVKYLCDWASDDQPFWFNVAEGRLASVPYTQHVNDLPMVPSQKRSNQDSRFLPANRGAGAGIHPRPRRRVVHDRRRDLPLVGVRVRQTCSAFGLRGTVLAKRGSAPHPRPLRERGSGVWPLTSAAEAETVST